MSLNRTYTEQAFAAKRKLHQQRARMSFKRKLESLDRLREWAKSLPKLVETEKP